MTRIMTWHWIKKISAVLKSPTETPEVRRAREKRLLDDAQRRALTKDGNRHVLANLAKR